MSDGQRVPFQYAVMEAADVQPSNFADGGVNPLFDAAHPGTVKALNNGRTAGVRAAYERGTAEAYKQELMADSQMHGIDPAAIEGMRAPMLVRLYAEGDNRANMGAKSQSQALGLSATEQAATDAALMDAGVLDVFGTGGLDSAGMVTGDVADSLTVGVLRLLYSGQYLTRAVGRDRLTESLREYMGAALATSVAGDMFGEQVGPGAILSALFAASSGQPTQQANHANTQATRQPDPQPAQGERIAPGGNPAGSRADAPGPDAPGPQPGAAGQGADQAGRSGPGQDAQDSSQQQDRPGDQGAGQDGRGAVEVGPFGPVLTQFRGDAQGAIQALTLLRSGEAVAALHHPEVGDIDLVWGAAPEGKKEGFGLAKLSVKHPEVLNDLQGFLSRLKKDPSQSGKNRIRLVDDKGTAVVRLQWEGASKTWLLTAFEEGAPEAATRTDTDSVSTKDDTASLGLGSSASVALDAAVDKKAPAALELSSPTAAEVVARQDAAEQADKQRAKDEAKAEADAKAERERKEVAARMDASAENFELGQDAGDAVSGQGGLMFSRAPGRAQQAQVRDAEHLSAVKRGDMATAQRLVNEAAAEAGYVGNDYRMQHEAPSAENDGVRLDELRDNGLVPDDYWTHPQWYVSTPEEAAAHRAVVAAMRSADARKAAGKSPGSAAMAVYRAIPKTVKDGAIRNGDWVTPSLEYAKMEGESIPGGYRIISLPASAKSLYWDGNSVAEFGYDDGQSYGYKNTKNNRKLLDAVTRDDAPARARLRRRIAKPRQRWSRARLYL